ncbi:PepSY-associated TM helix domain protein [Methylobacterium sp. 4-46]|uniref:peptidase n=1 Tax=unclassified Methylobacterium TaxID=2615210 RepID=UPI000152C7E7|nr:MULTISPECIES: peptidase [Methylobacterium]ACA15386.1 PepSY-associated TM helix domain protein [Methylobacterium sp. 4-46]WFT81107.1 PepSY domain-containing protein [Methylobacterium nodulans]
MAPRKRLTRWLHLGHRWLGIAAGLFVATWLLSGPVMLFVGFPALTEAERLAALPPLAVEAVRLGPQEALARAGLTAFPERVTLTMRGAVPVYRLGLPDGSIRALSAVTGEPVAPLTAEAALALARRHPAAGAVRDLGRVRRDQWTVTARYDALRPFRRVALGDAAGTELYLSEATGELALDTTRRERVWNWLGAVPHWLYLTPLRARAALWRGAVLWVSGLALAAMASGWAIGLLRLRRGRPTPYGGWRAWHHLAGVAGGLALTSFLLSGWLSVNPNRWFGPRMPDAAALARYAGPAAGFPIAREALAAAPPGTVELRFGFLGGAPRILAAGPAGVRPCCGTAVSEEAIRAAARHLVPGAGLAAVERVAAPDAYWSDRGGAPRLPVLRLVLDDPAETWIHADPATGEILGRLDRSGRAQRWLFDALHTLDVGPLLRHPPLRRGVIAALCGLGLIVATSGVVLGGRRLRAVWRRRA